MKNIGILVIILSLIFLTSCEEDRIESVECELITEALVNYNSENLKAEVDKLTIDLKPHISDNDSYGHRENLNTLIDRLNSQCDNFEASLFCYACIETLPPQSEISILVDSSGTDVYRIIDISTPEDDNLSFVGVELEWVAGLLLKVLFYEQPSHWNVSTKEAMFL